MLKPSTAMPNPIKAAYWENLDHLVQAAEEIPRKGFSLPSRVIIIVLGPVIFGVMFYSQGGDYWFLWFIGALLFYYGYFWLLLFSRGSRRRQLRSALKHHVREQPLAVEWIFSEADVIQRGGAESSTRFAWEHFTRAIRKPGGFLLETPGKLFHWIPRTALASDADCEALANLLKQKISRFEEAN